MFFLFFLGSIFERMKSKTYRYELFIFQQYLSETFHVVLSSPVTNIVYSSEKKNRSSLFWKGKKTNQRLVCFVNIIEQHDKLMKSLLNNIAFLFSCCLKMKDLRVWKDSFSVMSFVTWREDETSLNSEGARSSRPNSVVCANASISTAARGARSKRRQWKPSSRRGEPVQVVIED